MDNETTNTTDELGASLMELDPNAKKPAPPISEEDKEKFFKSVISDTPYSETISLFDGKLTVTFQTMTVAENADVVAQIALDRDRGIASNDDAYFVTISCYRLALALQQIGDDTFSEVTKESFKAKDDEKGVSYVKARADKLRNWPTFKLSAFLDAFSGFETKVVSLTNAVQTQNFWKASA